MPAVAKLSLRALIYLDPGKNGRQKGRVCVGLKMKRQGREACSSIEKIGVNERREPYEMRDKKLF